jgi:hypothetical protein
MKLNLPLYSTSEGQKQRVIKARARANKLAVDLIKSIPKVDTTQLESTINTILSSGSIPSLRAASEIANTPDPNPYKEDREKSINRSGYAIVNENNIFKLEDNTNVEPFRMLYMAGYTIKEIKEIFGSMTPSSTYVAKVGKTVVSSTLQQKELLHKSKYRFYSEYYSKLNDKSYLVYDTKNGDSGFFAIVCEQDDNNKAYFKCKPKEFPISGTLEIVVDNTNYQVTLEAEIGKQLEVQIKNAEIPISVSYEDSLVISSDKPFYFVESDVAYKLGIKDELINAQQQIKEGYTGYSIINEGSYPYNCQVNKPLSSALNSRVIYNSLINQGLPEEFARKYINGEPLYDDINNDLVSLRETLDNEELTDIKLNNLYKKNNVRIESTSYQTIKRLLELSDNDLEYLLRYREDVIGINPYVTNQECSNELVKTFNSNVVFTNNTSHDCDIWKSIQSTLRYAEVLHYDYKIKKETDINSGDTKEAENKFRTFLGAVDETLFSTKEVVNSNAYFSETCLGMDVACSANLSAIFSVAGGLKCVGDVKSQISIDAFEEFMSDCLVLEAYLNSAFTAFNSIMTSIKGVISLINSSLTVFSGSGTASLGVGSIVQCSLSLDIALILPPFLSKLSLLLVPIIEMLEAVVNAIISAERSILCPIQNLIDKYINSQHFTLPCKVGFNVPIILGIDAYFQGYVNALAGLKAICLSVKQDTNWLRKNVSMLPNSIDLLVTNSESCKES